MGAMASTARARLAKNVKARRLQLGLARKRAADLAGMSKDTWQRIEEGEVVREMNYAKVDPVLGWAPGSCQAILDGHEAVPTKPSEDVPGVDISRPPVDDVSDKTRDVLQLALIATTTGLTSEQIRDFSERAIRDLRERGII